MRAATSATSTAVMPAPSVQALVADEVADRSSDPFTKTGAERRRRFLTVIYALLVTAVILGMRSRWFTAGVVDECLFSCGMVLATIGCLGRLWSSLFIAGYKTRHLVTDGPYSICRNPLYFFSALGLLGVGLCSSTFTIPAVMAVSFAIYYPSIIRREEQRLLACHGDEFLAYCARTPAFFPRLSQFVEPATHLVHTRPYRRSFFDAVWFIWLAALIHAAGHLHQQGMLPNWIMIY